MDTTTLRPLQISNRHLTSRRCTKSPTIGATCDFRLLHEMADNKVWNAHIHPPPYITSFLGVIRMKPFRTPLLTGSLLPSAAASYVNFLCLTKHRAMRTYWESGGIKVKLSVCLTKHRAVRTYWDSGGIKVKSLCLTKHHAMKTYWGAEV